MHCFDYINAYTNSFYYLIYHSIIILYLLMSSSYLVSACLLLFVLLTGSLHQSSTTFQSGIRTFITQRHSRLNVQTSNQGSPFTILYSKSFLAAPLALVAPLSFSNEFFQYQSQSNISWSRVHLKTTAISSNEMSILITGDLHILFIRASYLFIQQEVSRSLGLYIINPQKQQLKDGLSLNKDNEKVIEIKQILENSSSKLQAIERTSITILPFISQVYQWLVFTQEFNMVQREEIFYKINLSQKQTHLQIIFALNFAEKLFKPSLPAYSLLALADTHRQNQISFEILTVSIPSQPFSKKIFADEAIFIGLTGLHSKKLDQVMRLQFSKVENYYTLSSDKKRDHIAEIDLAVIALATDGESLAQRYSSRLLITCLAPTFVTTYVNHWTTWVDPTSSSTQTCQPCPTGCYDCVYCSNCLRFVNCTLCRAGFNYVKLNVGNYPANQMVCTCPTNTYPNATTNTCMGCSSVIANCASCLSYPSGHYSATCSTCNKGFFALANSGSWGGYTQCTPCIPGCAVCSGVAVNCSACATGLTKVSGVCVCKTAGTFYSNSLGTCTTCALAITNCTSCLANGTTTTCATCATGFFVSNGTCVACLPNCNSCTALICTNCAATFVVSGTSCVCSTTPQMFLNTTSNTCAVCTAFVPLCSVCSIAGTTVSCATCNAGAYLNGSSCVTCPTLCTACTDPTACLSCISNLVVINGTCGCDNTNGSYLDTTANLCISCSQKFSLCTSCSLNSNSSALECVACSVGSFLTSSSCTPCPNTCLNCTAVNICEACVTGYQLNNVTNLCDCIDCATCNASNVTNCVTCDLTNATNVFCTLCLPGTYLQNGTCITCPVGCATCTSSTNCQTCTLPFITSTPIGQCICNSINLVYYDPILQTCGSCTSIMGASCTSCSSSNYATVCLGCTAGNFVNNGTCSACISPCTACSAASVCSACAATYTLISNACTCDTANQIFLNTGTSLCESCSTLTTTLCLSCTPNALAVATSGIACSSCQVGYFADPGTYLCTQCPSTCTTCTGLTSCTQCLDTFALTNGTCICDATFGIFLHNGICLSCYAIMNYCQTCENSTGVILCAACGPGTYLSTGNTSCLLCPVNCDSCDSTGCLFCSAGYFPNAGVCDCMTTCLAYNTADPSCVDCNLAVNATANTSTLFCLACKLSTFQASSQTCNACPTSCLTCTNFITCLTCAPSFTLVNSMCVCNTDANDVAFGSICQNCADLVIGCEKCTVAGSVATCTQCRSGWGIEAGLCVNCGLGCQKCTVAAGVPTCTQCFNYFTYSAGSCSATTACNNNVGVYYSSNTSACASCMANCAVCYDGTTCVTCKPTFSYILSKCICNSGLSIFFDSTVAGGSCITCQTALDTLTSPYLANCKVCIASTAHYINGIECLECADGYFLSAGTCVKCMNGCQKCSTSTTCCSCSTPLWVMVNGTCQCNTNLNYFYDGNSSCLTCALTNCSVCSNLTTCLLCNIDSFINGAGACQLSACGNGAMQGIEQCDDGNTISGDGCSSTCLIQLYYYCVNTPPPSVCFYDSRFNVKVTQIIAGCNKITFKFQIYPFDSIYNQGNFSNFLQSFTLNSSITLVSYQQSNDIISYTFTFAQSLQGVSAVFTFDPSSLLLTKTASYPLNVITFTIIPTNNVLALHYEDKICQSMISLQKTATAIEYASYGTMMLSVLPCKIVGLELMGVLQLSFFSLGSMDNVNVLMSPMMNMKGVNGYAMNMGNDPSKKRLLQSSTSLTPSRVNSIGYNANFLRNCNAMLILVVAVIVIAFCLYVLTCLIQKCAQSLHSISKRLIKEVLLTLILFNCLNFAYSAGIHFKYAIPEDSLYTLGTLAAVATLVIPVLMAIGLSMSEEDGFGEFKDKLKSGCVEKAYFVVTIVYRMCLGLYMSASNQDQLSTLIVLAVSILFLLYNLVNLPFTKAYHNYRANVCHVCQFIVLFIAMYYRSMKSSSSASEVAGIYSPVYLEYACIIISLVVSLIVLIYEIYVWIKECFEKKEEDKNQVERKNSDISEGQLKVINPTMKSIQSEVIDQPIAFDSYDDSDLYN